MSARTWTLSAITALAITAAGLAATPAQAAPVCPNLGSLTAPYDHLDWSGCDLTGANLNGVDLTGTTMSGANLTGAIFQFANLTDAVLTGATVTGTNFYGANVTGTTSGGLVGVPQESFRNNLVLGGYLVGAKANLAGVDLHGQDLRGLALGTTNFTATDLHGANLGGAGMGDTTFTGANLAGADLTNTDFTYAVLTNADLSGANLTGTKFLGATLTGTIFTGATWSPSTMCPDGTDARHHQSGTCSGPTDYVPPFIATAVPASQAALSFPVRWTYSDPAPAGSFASGVSVVRVSGFSVPAGTRATNPYEALLGIYNAPTRSFVQTGAYGTTYCYRSKAFDKLANSDYDGVPSCTSTPFDERSFLRGAGWHRVTARGFLGRSYLYTGVTGAWLQSASALTVSHAALIATTCPKCGSVTMYVGRTKVGTVSLAKKTTTARAVVSFPWLPAHPTGVVKLVVSKPGLVRVDGVVVNGY